MAGGRPRIYVSDEELEDTVNKYFIHILGQKETKVDDKGNMREEWTRLPEPATITGLALYLGFESRQSIYDYEKEGQFSYIIKNARLRVECEYEKKLTTAQSPTGAIFALKNMGWKDKQELTGGEGMPLIPTVVTIQPIQSSTTPIAESEEE